MYLTYELCRYSGIHYNFLSQFYLILVDLPQHPHQFLLEAKLSVKVKEQFWRRLLWITIKFNCKYMLEKTEGTIKNGLSRDTCNIGYTRQRSKTNNIKHTTQKTKKMSNTYTTKNQRWTQTPAKSQQFLSYRTPAMLLI